MKSAPFPTRNNKNELVFDDYPDFRPNKSPKEIFHEGVFGGTIIGMLKIINCTLIIRHLLVAKFNKILDKNYLKNEGDLFIHKLQDSFIETK